MNYKYLSKYHYIYRLSFGGDRKAHVEKIPIAYANKHYVYVIEPGSVPLRRLTLEPTSPYHHGDIFTEVNNEVKDTISKYLLARYRDFTAHYGVYSFSDFWFLLDDPASLKEMANELQSYDLQKLYLTSEVKRLELAVSNARYSIQKRTEELEDAKRHLEELEKE